MAWRQPYVSTFTYFLLLARSIMCVTISPVPVPGVEPELTKAFRGQAVYLSPEEANNVRRSVSPNLYSPSTSNNWDYDNQVGSYDYFPKYRPSYPGYEQTPGQDKCGGGWSSGGNNWNQGSGGRWPSGSGSNWGSSTGGWNQGGGSNWNPGGGSSWNPGGGSNWNQGGSSNWNQGGGRDWSQGSGGSGWNQGGRGSGWNQGGWNQGSGNLGGTGNTGWNRGNQGGWDQGGGGTLGWGGWTTGSGGWSKLPSQPGNWNQGGGQWNQNSDRKWGTGWSGGSNSLDDCGYKCDNQGIIGFYGKSRRN